MKNSPPLEAEIYHACSQAQLSKERIVQMHPAQNQGYLPGRLPDQELYDPGN